MSGVAVATVTGIVASAVLTLIGAYWLFVLQRKRELLSFEVLTRAVVIPVEFGPGDPLQVTVRSDVLRSSDDAGDAEAGAEYVAAGRVYGFRVRFRNPGDDALGEHTVYIELDEEARIASIELERAPKGVQPGDIATGRQADRPNVGYCRFSFLNRREEIVVSILSVANASPYCQPYAREKGLILQDLGQRAARLVIASYAAAIVGALGFVGASVGGTLAYGLNSSPGDVLGDRPEGWIVYGFMIGGTAVCGLALALAAAIVARRFGVLGGYWRRQSG